MQRRCWRLIGIRGSKKTIGGGCGRGVSTLFGFPCVLSRRQLMTRTDVTDRGDRLGIIICAELIRLSSVGPIFKAMATYLGARGRG